MWEPANPMMYLTFVAVCFTKKDSPDHIMLTYDNGKRDIRVDLWCERGHMRSYIERRIIHPREIDHLAEGVMEFGERVS